MRIVEYKVEIAAFDEDYLPDDSEVINALEEAVTGLNTNGGSVTVRASMTKDISIDLDKCVPVEEKTTEATQPKTESAPPKKVAK